MKSESINEWWKRSTTNGSFHYHLWSLSIVSKSDSCLPPVCWNYGTKMTLFRLGDFFSWSVFVWVRSFGSTSWLGYMSQWWVAPDLAVFVVASFPIQLSSIPMIETIVKVRVDGIAGICSYLVRISQRGLMVWLNGFGNLIILWKEWIPIDRLCIGLGATEIQQPLSYLSG